MNNQILVEGQFGHGGIQDTPDIRDYQYKDIAGATAPFDWNLGFDIESKLGYKIKVKDQGSSSSCGGQAVSYLSGGLESLYSKSFEERSAKYIYAQTHVVGGGSMARDNADIFVKQGVARESVLPSYPNTEDNLTRSEDILPSVRQDAQTDMALIYSQVPLNIEDVAQAIRDNNGVVMGLAGQNNGTWLSAYPQPPLDPNIEKWNHFVYACKAKLVNGIKFVGIINSWGEEVGEAGVQWLSESYFTSGNIWSVYAFTLRTPQTTTAHFDTDMSYMQSSDEIKRLQLFLTGLGYFNATITGYYGNITRDAVYAFQVDHVKLSIWEYFVTKGRLCGSKTRQALNLVIDNKN